MQVACLCRYSSNCNSVICENSSASACVENRNDEATYFYDGQGPQASWLPQVVKSNVGCCAGFWTPASREAPRTQAAGVQKAPGHEVAGSWEAAGRRALWGFQVSAEFAGGRDTGATRPACSHAGAGERVRRAPRRALERINGRRAP